MPTAIARRIMDKLAQLGTKPRPPGSKPLSGGDGRTRIRIGDYRVVYRVLDAELVVLTVQVGHRREIYR